MTATQTLIEIGKRNDLFGRTLKDFVNFFKMRFPHHVKKDYVEAYYADTWADRFTRHPREYMFGDLSSRKILRKINPGKYNKLVERYGD